MSTVVTLLTDFGTADGYVAEMKGVLLRAAPGIVLVDLTHDISPGDIESGAYVLGRAWNAFPEGAVHVAVVDPGVGTTRRGLAAEVGGHRFVAPDNGLLSWVFETGPTMIVSLPVPPKASRTFHGRDLFAPAAARLALGAGLADLGGKVEDAVRLPRPTPVREGRDLVGVVVHVDRFGTLITNIPGARVAEDATVRIGPYDLALRSTFDDVPSGDPVAFVGSGGAVEIAVRDGRADSALGASRGAGVRATAKAVR
ncbi:MAG: SAM-dependent chlorinase/fluorinase [Gemmatimonadales bacterium]|nr:SAM-dependent chlorinase/fluorinase [Gemmatimonadales bacterium]